MILLVPVGLVACAALWLKGLKSLWQRALLLVVFLVLLGVLLPSMNQNMSLAYLAIYQQEAQAFAARVAAHIERGDSEGAKKQLVYFTKNQDWSTANDPDSLRSFYQGIELAGQGAATSAAHKASHPSSR